MTPASSIVRIAMIAAPSLTAVLAGHFPARPDWRCCAAPSLESLVGSETPPDLLILDADACRDASPEALAWLREFDGPVVVIGGGDSSPPLAAVAHFPRPFRLTELFEYIQSALTRPQPRPRVLAPASLRLTEKEAAIFARLAAAAGGVVARSQLLSEVWGYGPGVSTRTLETHISRLRRKLAAAPAPGWRLLSATGGYRLVDSDAAGPENSGEGGRNPLG